MNLSLSSKLVIINGHGQIDYPLALKREALKTTLQCECLFFSANPKAKNQPYFLICEASTYCTRDNTTQPNILGIFQNKPETHVATFSFPVPITAAQEKLDIKIVDYLGTQENLSCIGVV